MEETPLPALLLLPLVVLVVLAAGGVAADVGALLEVYSNEQRGVFSPLDLGRSRTRLFERVSHLTQLT